MNPIRGLVMRIDAKLTGNLANLKVLLHLARVDS